MPCKYLLSFVLFLIVLLVHPILKGGNAVIEHDSAFTRIEDYLLSGKNDSAAILIQQLNSSEYLQSLKRITNNEAGYTDFSAYLTRLENRDDIPYLAVANYIDKTIAAPSDEDQINLDYVHLLWNQVSRLRDDVSVEAASDVQVKLENYVNQFDSANPNVQKAQIKARTHQMVMQLIQRNLEMGKALCEQNYELAEQLGDKELMIACLYHLCDFIVFEGKLDEYIQICEQCLKIEQTLSPKSAYYSATLVHAVDAYIYKGDNEERIQELLNELYSLPQARAQSYSLYAKYLGVLNLNRSVAKNIFEQFQVSNLLAFCEKTEILAIQSLNSNDLYQFQREVSNTLEMHGYLKEAIAFKDKTVVSIKKIYSQDLANSLASYKTAQAVKQKDLEIQHQNERNRLYLIILFLAVSVLLITVLVLLRIRKQSRVLEVKNFQINKTLKEKELLVREVHHRVKNNFQIVSSLLELQSRDIKDEKARILANEGQNRVKSMALIHQKLYQNEDGLIDFDEYVHLLVNELSALFASDVKVDTKVNAENMRFDVDTAIPLGLIINELITNAYKYAFSNTKKGKLNISITQLDEEQFKLVVADNGSGLPEDIDVRKVKSLGIRLVTRLVKQLHGKLNVENTNGACFEIIFKDITARKKMN